MRSYPQSRSDAPFEDPNLTLPVLDALMRGGLLDLGRPEDLASHVLGRRVLYEEDGWDLMEAVLNYLQRYPLHQSLLDQVDALWLGAGLRIYTYPFFHWDGDGSFFDVVSLRGIEKCPNISEFDTAASMWVSSDLSPLASLRRLKRVRLDRAEEGPWEGLSVLSGLPVLEEFRYFETDVSVGDEPVLRALARRGVRLCPFRDTVRG